MKTTKVIVLTAIISLFVCFSSGALAKGRVMAPEVVVANLYKQHRRSSPFFQKRNRPLVDKFFAKELADLVWKDANTTRDEVGPLNGDPLYNAQDTDIKNFSIGKAVVSGATAQVKVTFINFDRKEEILFDLTLRGNAWKVSNITYQDGTNLIGIFKGEG